MGRLTHLGSVALVVVLFVITGTIAWVLVNSVEQATEISEETEEIRLVLEIESEFHGQVEVANQLVTEMLSERPAGTRSESSTTGDALGAATEGEPPPTPHPNLADHGIESVSGVFVTNVSRLEPLLGDEAPHLNEVLKAHNSFLISVADLHDMSHGDDGANLMVFYHAKVQPLDAETHVAILHLRQAQNDEISVAVERMDILQTLLRREIPALIVLALVVAFAAYRLKSLWRRQRVEELENINQAKSEFIATVSHELRTPLTSVLGFADLLRDADDVEFSPSERAEMIESIAHQSLEVANIVEDLLVAVRAELGELKVASVPVDLRAQVAQVLESCQLDAAVSVETAEEAVRADGDPMRVRQILRNVLSNAGRYGGDVIRIEVGANSPFSVFVAVKDNGVGVPAQSQARMFQPFEQINSSPGPTGSIGLGLAVSRQLAQLMGGDLTYRYYQGESIFSLSLPGAPSSSHLTQQAESQTIPA